MNFLDSFRWKASSTKNENNGTVFDSNKFTLHRSSNFVPRRTHNSYTVKSAFHPFHSAFKTFRTLNLYSSLIPIDRRSTPSLSNSKLYSPFRRIDTKYNLRVLREQVNSSKTPVVSPRTPGSPPSTRLRKPTAFSSTSSQNKSPNALANNRQNRPADGNEKLDTTDDTPEIPKSEKDIDQSSRAQEIAVTLADPPTPRSSTTGRPSLRNALRRRISTTLAPRTDATTSRTTIGFAPVPRDRQKPKPKDRPQQNATTRPRRPQVIDYDYYEDEEEPVVGKSTYNGKLFLTSKGTIRCLDQGNFPHPYSCRKFITCAKMVNGLVVGAEYTCPDKLSYDPVGGICNWSAGLGCKE